MEITLSRIDKMTDEELENAIQACFAAAPETTNRLNRLSILLEAQFYRTEQYRRADEKAQKARDEVETGRWKIDQRNEILIIVMIAIEIFLAIGIARWSDHRQTEDMNQQLAAFGAMQKVLEHLDKSTEATAKTLVQLQKTSEDMNKSLEKQVELYYDVQLNINFEESSERLLITNTGHGRVSMARFTIEVDPVQDIKWAEPQVITPTGIYFIPLKNIKNYVTDRVPKGVTKYYAFTILLKNERGEKVTVIGNIIGTWLGDSLSIVSQTNTITGGWIKAVSRP
jgi:hypothetical protein